MLGTVGEYIVDSTVAGENIVNTIESYEKDTLNIKYLPVPFVLKKLGIKPESDCEIKINKHTFKLSANEPFEIGYNMMDIAVIESVDAGVKLTLRYLY